MSRRTFTSKQLKAILWGEEGTIVLNRITGSSRWSTEHDFVFKPEGGDKLYRTGYTKGATEYQDETPWAHEDEVECVEVEAFEKTVTDYRPVGDGGDQ